MYLFFLESEVVVTLATNVVSDLYVDIVTAFTKFEVCLLSNMLN